MSTSALPAPPHAPLALECFGITHAGRERAENEDAFACFPDDRLFVVADGMGGRNAGDVAAHLAIEEIAAFFRSHHADPGRPWPHPAVKDQSLGANLLRVALKVANDRIRAAAERERSLARMGCTAIAMAIGDAQVAIAHAGDTRAYRLRDGALRRLTTDHSVLYEMLAARPDMTRDEVEAFSHRNVITKALGSKAHVDPAVYCGQARPGDLLLLCSDGLWTPVPSGEIEAILRSTTTDLEAACQLLVDAANAHGGPDNITALLVRLD